MQCILLYDCSQWTTSNTGFHSQYRGLWQLPRDAIVHNKYCGD